MKWISSLLLLAAAQFISATPQLHKRATSNDVATVGYATLNGGTTGGSGGTVTRVSTLAALKTAVTGDAKKIVILSGTITGNEVVEVGSNTSLLGASSSTSLVGVGIRVLSVSNVIVRNLKISKVLAEAGDALGIQSAHQVWIDHVDLSSDRDHDKDFYDGLLDITHGCTGVTVTWSILRDHWKASLVGHSDSNGAEDTPITVTYANNYWTNLNSRTPSFRFGHGHLFNNYFLANEDGINTRDGAQLLVENNVWSGCKNSIYATDAGFAVARGNDYGGENPTAGTGTFTTAPYSYSLTAVGNVVSTVLAGAGANLAFA